MALSTMYVTQLNPTMDVLTRHAIQIDRLINSVTQSANASLTDPSGLTILVKFPSLLQVMVVVTGIIRLLYNVTLTRGTDLTARFVQNLGHVVTERLKIRMQEKEINSLQFYGDSWAIHDLYLTVTQRATVNCSLRGCDDQAESGKLTLSSGSSSGSTGGPYANPNLAFGRYLSNY